MKITILTSMILFTTSMQGLCVTYTHEEKEAIRNRGEMLHYGSLEKYRQARQGQKKYLVVGCGHDAFKFDDKTGTIISAGRHGPDTTSKDRRFSHADSFTINAHDGQFGIRFYPDVNGIFPKDLSPTEKFDEIFFETIEDRAYTMYEDAFDRLNPGGVLVDNRYGNDDGTDFNALKSQAIDRLVRIGFVMIEFKDNITDPHNGRENSRLVYATKPYNSSKNKVLVDYNNPVVNTIAAEVQRMKANGSFTTIKFYELLKGYYRNVPDTFRALYIEFMKK